MAKIDRLLKGYQRFHSRHFQEDENLYKKLVSKGQMAKSLVIGCCDSRVDPTILFDARPGDIFAVRNVANIVPPYKPTENSYHGTSAAIEFAVNMLKVEHIIILGHSSCAGIANLLMDKAEEPQEYSFISNWVNILSEAKEKAIVKCKHNPENLPSICEKEGILVSLKNLETFPWVKEKLDTNQIEIHGLHFSIFSGQLQMLTEQGEFEAVECP